MRQPLLVVFWKDAWMDFEVSRSDLPSAKEVKVMKTVGWLVRRTDEVISLAAEVNVDDDLLRGVTHIPRSLVVKEEEVKYVGPPSQG